MEQMSLKEFSRREKAEPRSHLIGVRVPVRLAKFVRATALLSEVNDSEVIRYALTRYAAEQGYGPTP